MTKLQARRIKAFTTALRSGKYKQGQRMLRSGDRFCCLGVACEVYRKREGKGKWDGSGFVTSSTNYVTLPEEVVKYYGFLGYNPGLGRGRVYATTRNDIHCQSFKYLANLFDSLIPRALREGL